MRWPVYMSWLIVLAMAAPNLYAQDDRRDRRRELVQKALDALIGGLKPNDTPPPTPTPGTPLPGTRPVPVSAAQVRGEIQKLAGDVDYLVRLVLADNQRVPRDPRFMVDANNIRTQALNLAALAARTQDLNALSEAYQQYDARWHPFDASLQKLKDPHPSIAAVVTRIHQGDETLNAMLGIAGPAVPSSATVIPSQFNSQKLYPISATLQRDVQHLVDDVEIELEGARSAEALKRDVRAMSGHSEALMKSIQQNNVNSAIDSWKKFDASWRTLQEPLGRMVSRHVERSRQRVDTSYQDLLNAWGIRPAGVDRNQLQQWATTQQQDLQQILAKVPLSSLVQTPYAAQFASDAAASWQASNDFVICLQRGDDFPKVIEAYLAYDEANHPLLWKLQRLPDVALQADLDRLAKTSQLLRSTLRIPDENLTSSTPELAKALYEAADHLARDIRDDLQNHPQCIALERQGSDFAQVCLQFQKQVSSPVPLHIARSGYADVHRRWSDLAGPLSRLDPQKYDHLHKTSARLQSVLEQLETSLGLSGPQLRAP